MVQTLTGSDKVCGGREFPGQHEPQMWWVRDFAMAPLGNFDHRNVYSPKYFRISYVYCAIGLKRIRRMLETLILVEPNSPIYQTPEDLFSSGLTTLFPDDTLVQHGDSHSKIIYKSVCGDLEFRCADVISEEERTKFAHYLWNSGILMGELVGGRRNERDNTSGPSRPLWLPEAERAVWMAKGHKLLELGAGV
jgi:hypothetical protein